MKHTDLPEILIMCFKRLSLSFLVKQLSLFAYISLLLNSCISSRGRYTGYLRHAKSNHTNNSDCLSNYNSSSIATTCKQNDFNNIDSGQSIKQNEIVIKQEFYEGSIIKNNSKYSVFKNQTINTLLKNKPNKPKSVSNNKPLAFEAETNKKLTTNDIILIILFFTGLVLLLISFIFLFTLSQPLIPFTFTIILTLGTILIFTTYIIAILLKNNYKTNKKINWHITLILALGGILSAIIVSGAITIGALAVFAGSLSIYTSLLWLLFGFLLTLLLILLAMLIAFK